MRYIFIAFIFLILNISFISAESNIVFIDMNKVISTSKPGSSMMKQLNARNEKSDATKVTFLAKIKTSVQLSTLSIYLFGLAINNMLIIVIADILLFISLFITLYTGFIYTLNTFKNEEA